MLTCLQPGAIHNTSTDHVLITCQPDQLVHCYWVIIFMWDIDLATVLGICVMQGIVGDFLMCCLYTQCPLYQSIHPTIHLSNVLGCRYQCLTMPTTTRSLVKRYHDYLLIYVMLAQQNRVIFGVNATPLQPSFCRRVQYLVEGLLTPRPGFSKPNPRYKAKFFMMISEPATRVWIRII